jgi:hypothetical protein
MNEVRYGSSGRVQRASCNLAHMIGDPGFRPVASRIPAKEDTTMFKTISAALVGVALLAAPAFAGTYGNKTTHAPVIKASHMKAKVLNANARMGRHHHRQVHHHRFHKR